MSTPPNAGGSAASHRDGQPVSESVSSVGQPGFVSTITIGATNSSVRSASSIGGARGASASSPVGSSTTSRGLAVHGSQSRKRPNDSESEDLETSEASARHSPKRRRTQSPPFRKPMMPVFQPGRAPGVSVVVMAGVEGLADDDGDSSALSEAPDTESSRTRMTRWLSRIKIMVGSHRNRIIELQSTCTVLEAFGTLVDRNILSAPIWDGSQSYLGIVDLLDLVHLVVRVCKNNVGSAVMDKLVAEPVFSQPVTEIANLSRLNPYRAVKVGSSILMVMRALGIEKLHRVAVEDAAGRAVGLISQLWLVEWLHANVERFTRNAHKTVAELGFLAGDQSHVVTVRESQLALEAFSAMVDAGVSAVGIVNEHGVLVGAVSVRDIRAIRRPSPLGSSVHFDQLRLPVLEFLRCSRSERVDTDAYPLLFCTPHTKLSDIAARLVATRIHRMFVVDEDQRPISVIALSDIITRMLPEFEPDEATLHVSRHSATPPPPSSRAHTFLPGLPANPGTAAKRSPFQAIARGVSLSSDAGSDAGQQAARKPSTPTEPEAKANAP